MLKSALIIWYKAFDTTLQIDFSNVFYNQAYNISFPWKIIVSQIKRLYCHYKRSTSKGIPQDLSLGPLVVHHFLWTLRKQIPKLSLKITFYENFILCNKKLQHSSDTILLLYYSEWLKASSIVRKSVLSIRAHLAIT